MDDENEKDEPKVQADNNSIAVGKISAGGDISGSIHIGDKVYQYESEEDVPLTSEEIKSGLNRFAEYLPERAPILHERFSSIAKKLRATLGADSKSLSSTLKAQREDTVNEMKLMSMEVLDISFRALSQGQNPPPYDSRAPFRGLFAFRSDGQTLASGSQDGTTVLWDIAPQSWIQRTCERVGRNLTRAEWAQYIPYKPYPTKQEEATCPKWPLEPEPNTTPTANP